MQSQRHDDTTLVLAQPYLLTSLPISQSPAVTAHDLRMPAVSYYHDVSWLSGRLDLIVDHALSASPSSTPSPTWQIQL